MAGKNDDDAKQLVQDITDLIETTFKPFKPFKTDLPPNMKECIEGFLEFVPSLA